MSAAAVARSSSSPRRARDHSPGVGFWATPELLEFYGTPNMDYAFSFLARFLAKSSLFLAFCAFFASRRVLLAHEAGGQPDGDAHPRHSRLPPARDTAQPCSSSRAQQASSCESCVCSSLTLQLHYGTRLCDHKRRWVCDARLILALSAFGCFERFHLSF